MSSKSLLDLSNEVLETIFLKLPQFDVQHNVALVCRRFLDITRMPKMVQSVAVVIEVEDTKNK